MWRSEEMVSQIEIDYRGFQDVKDGFIRGVSNMADTSSEVVSDRRLPFLIR